MRAALIMTLLLVSFPLVAQGEQASDEGPRVAILEATFSRSIHGPLQERILDRLLQHLRDESFEVIERAMITEALEPLGPSLAQSCRSGHCARWILDALDADAGLVVAINAEESSYSIALTVLGPSGDELFQTTSRCDICTFEELIEAIVETSRELEGEIPNHIREGHLGVTTNPRGAEIRIDGVSLGQSSLVVALPPGIHVVDARLRGHSRALHEIEVIAEQTTTVRLDLTGNGVSRVRVSGSPHRRNGLRATLWTTFALGLALTITGSVLMGLDPSCLEDGPDDDCARTWEGQHTFGAGFVGSGVSATVAAGLALLVMAL